MSRRGGAPVIRRRRRIRELPELRSLMIITFAGLMGSAASTSLGAFFVDAAVDTGIAEGNAGFMFAIASALGFTSRVVMGWRADVHPHGSPYGRIAVLLAIGAPGYLLLSTGVPTPYVVGGMLAYGAGWAWPGLYHYAAVSQNPTMPAAATGVIQSGMSMGAGLGPLALGWLAESSSYQATWIAAATLSASAAIATLVGRAHLRRSRTVASVAYLAEVAEQDPGEGRTVAAGVELRSYATAHLDVSVFRVEPDASYTVPPLRRSGVVLMLAGQRCRLGSASEGVVRVGEHRPVPANRSWSLRNEGEDLIIMVQATAHGRVDEFGVGPGTGPETTQGGQQHV